MRLRNLRLGLAVVAILSLLGMMIVMDGEGKEASSIQSMRTQVRAVRSALLKKKFALDAIKRNGSVLPTQYDFLETVPGLSEIIVREEEKRSEMACDWMQTEGWDLFRGTCDQAAFEVSKDQSVTEACAKACDATENGGCKAWTSLGLSCFLKGCSEHSPRKAKVLRATSAIRRDDKACGRLRKWVVTTKTLDWLPRWRRTYGDSDTFLTHKRTADDSIKFAPIVTIRGERHSGTNWIRAILNRNCLQLAHRLGPSLDSDAAWGWKHAMSPKQWSPQTKDIMIVLIRSAATWVPKMRKVSYNADLDRRKTNNLAAFLDLAFIDNYSTRRYANVLDMRAAKYRDYRDLAHRCPGTVLAVRYEDLLKDGGAFMMQALRTKLPDECAPPSVNMNKTAFLPVTNYAKFGSVSSAKAKKPHEDAAAWSHYDWSALLRRLDADLETSLGYRYSPTSPGSFEVIDPPQSTTWLTLPTELPPFPDESNLPSGRRRRR